MEILELVDMDWKGFGSGCNRFHLMPRFARSLPGLLLVFYNVPATKAISQQRSLQVLKGNKAFVYKHERNVCASTHA